jgi:hypothetical protein
MPDNWGFVAAAYGLAVVVFGGYWRWLARKDRELAALAAGRVSRAAADSPDVARRPVRP